MAQTVVQRLNCMSACSRQRRDCPHLHQCAVQVPLEHIINYQPEALQALTGTLEHKKLRLQQQLAAQSDKLPSSVQLAAQAAMQVSFILTGGPCWCEPWCCRRAVSLGDESSLEDTDGMLQEETIGTLYDMSDFDSEADTLEECGSQVTSLSDVDAPGD